MTKITMADWALSIALLILCLLYLFAPVLGFAQDARSLTPVERELALTFARVSFNEARDSEADQEMIWQIVSARDGAHSQLQWLRNHSPCVTGVLTQDQAYQRPGNCRWSRNLMPDGRRPRGWDRERDGRWSWIRTRWLEHLRRSVEYVRGERVADICSETPQSWDGRRYGRDTIEARGWRILECDGELQNYAVVRTTGRT